MTRKTSSRPKPTPGEHRADPDRAAREQAKEAAIMEAEGKLREAKHTADTASDARTQAEKFKAAAREFGAD